MKKNLLLLLTTLLFVTSFGQTNILTLGESTTETPPSYRRKFCELMTAESVNFNMVGPKNDGETTYDGDHGGYIGGGANGVMNEFNKWFQNYNPEIVLLWEGTNDCGGQSTGGDTTAIGIFINRIIFCYPNAKIFVGKIPPMSNTAYSSYLGNGVAAANAVIYNNNLPTVVSKRFNAGKNVYLVDGALTLATDVSGDGVHPNQEGYDKMGVAFFNAVKTQLAPVNVTGVSIPSTASVATGNSITLTATVIPSNATNKNITWSSSNTSIASVNSSGVVSGIAVGSTTITATSDVDNTKKGTCTLTVTTPAAVTSVSIPSTASINKGSTSTLLVTVLPSNATQLVNWSSSNTAIATVSSSGVVTAVAVGSATITATSTADATKKGTCAVTVVEPPTKYEAESATLSGGAKTNTNHSGYSGSGFIDFFEVVGATATFNVSVSVAGSYNVSLRYCNSMGNIRTLSVYVNGTKIKQTSLANLANWDTWSDQIELLSLNAGSNTIAYKYDSSDNGFVNLDYIYITSGGGSNVAVTGVSLSPITASIAVGATTTLTATVTPSNATNKNVTWSSSNTAVATVNSDGLVTGVAAGTATIIVTTADAGKTASCNITIVSCCLPSPNISLSPTSISVAVNSSSSLTATITPSNAVNKNVTWSSSNISVATVSSTGVVTGVAVGNATITVTMVDGGKTATCAVTVTAAPNVSGNVIAEFWTGLSGTSIPTIPTSAPNSTSTLTSLEIPANAMDNYLVRISGYIVPTTSGDYTFYIASDDNGQLWLSTNSDPANKAQIATVGEWTASREWTKYASQKSAAKNLTANTKYYFEALMKEGGGGDNLAIGWTGPSISSITVIGAANIDKYTAAPVVAVTGVSVSPTTASIAVGATSALTVTVAPTNATNKNVTWSTSASSIATVSSTGVVTGVAAGTATITVTTADGAKTATCAVTVTDINIPVTSVTISPTTASVAVGATTTLTATVTPSNATNKNVTWSTSASSVATVSSTGVVTGVAVGSATITVTTADGAKTATCAVTVTTAPSITGTVEAEFWTGLSGTSIPTIPTSAPNSTSTLTSVEIPSNANDNYLVRIRGYIVPSTSGDYTFYIASDDNGQLHLSTNNDPANKAQIAYVGTWTNSREWTKETNQKSAAKSLTAGTKYYFEAIAKEGNGGDNLAVGWTGPGISAITVIGAANIDKYVPSGGGSVAVTGVTVSPTTLSIAVGGTSTLAATVAPSNATNKNVTWSTSASSIATVSSTGVVTAVAIGTATITVTTTDGAKTATCAVTVTGTSGIGNGSGLSYSYFNNKTLTGTAVVTGKEAVDFDWGSSAPKAGVGNDNYSVRWEGYVEAPIATNITFTTIADDGVRLWVDGTLVIDNWVDQAPTSKSSLAISFTAGQRKTIKMEYYEAGGGAVAKLHWAYTGVSIQAIPAKYLYDVTNKNAEETIENISTTNISNNANTQTFIYPNPVSGILYIANAQLNANITIYSIEGKVITNLKANSENMNIDVAGFNKGLYILSIQGANQNVVTRLVVK